MTREQGVKLMDINDKLKKMKLEIRKMKDEYDKELDIKQNFLKDFKDKYYKPPTNPKKRGRKPNVLIPIHDTIESPL